jgi:hypothetical protein
MDTAAHSGSDQSQVVPIDSGMGNPTGPAARDILTVPAPGPEGKRGRSSAVTVIVISGKSPSPP